MSRAAAIDDALRDAGIHARPSAVESLGGGCIHDVRVLRFDDRDDLVAKVAPMSDASLLHEEHAGLLALHATGAVCVPRSYDVHAAGGCAVLLMTYLPVGRATDDAWRELGDALAALHEHGPPPDAAGAYGFGHDNHLGASPQPNPWHDDWVEFNAAQRLGPHVRRNRDDGRLSRDLARDLDDIIARLDRLIPRHPRSGLLHGDLWSGNAVPTINAEGIAAVAIIDPACSYGDGWADIAMMRLFGGFGRPCFDAYAKRNDDHDDVETRIAVYQLYHVLNHVTIFGTGYVGQTRDLVMRLR